MADQTELRTAFHPSEYITEEMQARGWSRDVLACMMTAGTDSVPEAHQWFAENRDNRTIMHELQVNRCALDFYLDLGPTERNLRIGDESAQRLALAFGVSSNLFTNLETAWLGGSR
jgi:hypothetical protein